MRLNIRSFALACGLLWGLGLFLATWWIIAFDGTSTAPTFLSQLYRGYEITPKGSLIGLGWALVDGAMGGAILAWLYNVCAGLGSGSAPAPGQ
ncbi:bacteriophage holin [Prochlorothrix hollandica]|uniref:bacteriophage holin n=1 Tax=Prochlorothrix hollandica TaxID=1223 RepID=UPI00333FCE97